MSGVAITLRLDLEDAGVRKALSAMIDLGRDLTPVLEDSGAELESSTLERFQTNLAPDGTPWRPSLASQVTGKPTLVGEGFLRDSVNYRLDGTTAVEIGAGGVAADYAAVHQLGATITAKGGALRFSLATGGFATVKSVTIPARPYLGVSDQDARAIVDIVGDHWARAAGGAH
ncbi:MAG: phage virion morphogenesis protein [Phenylobacterium sp.]|uniref:phage virion morphogenesis protein n=1 Tax=Phenylobacterium sp. TaxID=1871053 RepID=UPI00391ACCDD